MSKPTKTTKGLYDFIKKAEQGGASEPLSDDDLDAFFNELFEASDCPGPRFLQVRISEPYQLPTGEWIEAGTWVEAHSEQFETYKDESGTIRFRLINYAGPPQDPDHS